MIDASAYFNRVKTSMDLVQEFQRGNGRVVLDGGVHSVGVGFDHWLIIA